MSHLKKEWSSAPGANTYVAFKDSDSAGSFVLENIEDDESSTMMEATINQYHAALEQIIKKNAVVGTVTQLLKVYLA
ncbi:unnamed protein product [Gongylonema pulchrum]|uniref:DUF1330 domain-containing protein n=1 Tax=Gongylonema pulchrum TaxID=637853 RepID=A0A183DTI9_9BILA|nr:unnamed protein product [Gongylonema pulchrum]